MFVLLSDLLAPLDLLAARLGLLRARGHEVLVFQILDPREIDFEFDSAAQFTDMESGMQHFIDPAVARKRLPQTRQRAPRRGQRAVPVGRDRLLPLAHRSAARSRALRFSHHPRAPRCEPGAHRLPTPTSVAPGEFPLPIVSGGCGGDRTTDLPTPAAPPAERFGRVQLADVSRADRTPAAQAAQPAGEHRASAVALPRAPAPRRDVFAPLLRRSATRWRAQARSAR